MVLCRIQQYLEQKTTNKKHLLRSVESCTHDICSACLVSTCFVGAAEGHFIKKKKKHNDRIELPTTSRSSQCSL